MPNGGDKNFVRLCAAIDGFRIRHGIWPTSVRMYPQSLDDLRDHVFTPAAFHKIQEKIQLIPDEAPMIAEDKQGRTYDYGEEGFPEKKPDTTAKNWLAVRTRRNLG